MAFCTNCGTQLPEGTKFCVNCGAKVIDPASAQPEAPASAEPVGQAQPVASYEAPAPQAEPAQAASESPAQGSYQAPSSGSYVPPVVGGYTAPQQQTYTPPQAQGQSYTPPQQQTYTQQPQGQSYTPPQQQGYTQQPQGQSYTPPGQQSYAPPQGQNYSAAPTAYASAAKPKKPANKKLWIILGAVALAVIIGIILLVTLGGNKGTSAASDDPNLGLYNATTAEMMGIEMSVTDLWDNGFSIELKDKGKCAMNVDGTKGNGKWSVDEDGTFHIKGSGLDCSGTLGDGILVLENVLDMGVTLTFAKEGYVPASTEPDPGAVPALSGGDEDPVALSGDLTDLQKQWNGTWYGCLDFSEATGDYDFLDGERADAYMIVDVDADGMGTFTVYSMDEENPFAQGQCEAKDYGLDAISGDVVGTEINPHNWMFRHVPDYEDQFVISDEVETEDGTLEFNLFVKQWGGSWQPEIDSNFAIVPPSVEEYMQKIAAGELPPIGTAPYGYAGSASGAPAEDAFVSPTTSIELGSEWYGSMTISNYKPLTDDLNVRLNVKNGVSDIYAVVDTDSNGNAYFEVYPDASYQKTLYSVYIDLYDDHIVPIIGEDDAWFFRQYLTADQVDDYTMYLKDGVLELNRHFESDNETFDVQFYLREDGTPWNEAVDPLPLSYEEYKQKLGGDSGESGGAAAQSSGALNPGEPSSTGDGMLKSKDDLFKLAKWLWNMDYEYKNEKATYEFVRDYCGVEGLDDGNHGANSVNDLGDHYFYWKYDDTTFIFVGFRPNKNGDWVIANMNTSGFSISDIPESIQVSYD